MARADPLLVLEAFGLEYKVRGNRAWALCPYHTDKSPSWMMKVRGPRAGQHHCFSCKEGGGLVDLVMHVRGYGTRAAATGWLQEFAGGDEAPPAAPLAASIRVDGRPTDPRAFRMPLEYVHEPLDDWPSGARAYVERRRIDAAQVALYRIGYAVEGRLEGRIVVPVLDAEGCPVNYMARTFVDAERRYLYPAQKDHPDLDAMFGEHRWPPPGDRPRWAVVVTEGALNALAVERAVGGWAAVAALGGSDVRPEHARKLAAFGRVLVATDADPAGDRAAGQLRAKLARHTLVQRARPTGADLDERDPGDVRALLGCGA